MGNKRGSRGEESWRPRSLGGRRCGYKEIAKRSQEVAEGCKRAENDSHRGLKKGHIEKQGRLEVAHGHMGRDKSQNGRTEIANRLQRGRDAVW